LLRTIRQSATISFAFQELMMSLQRTIKAVIRPGEQSGFVAECLEIPVVTQGSTLDEVSANLREAVALHLEGENLAEYGLADSPSIIVTFELEAFPASA
jgi:predicted RNase H-like HicB family nuclease